MPTTANQELNVRRYSKQFIDMIQAVFGYMSYFTDFFAGGIEALDGVQHNAVAFSVKTSDIPLVINPNYNTDPNVAFGTGTSNSNRFGNRKEIIYIDTDVPYAWGWSFHEGIDRYTVNNAPDAAIADRLEIHSRDMTRKFNAQHSKFIASIAGQTLPLATYTETDVIALFDALYAYFLNIEAVGQKVIKVNAALYNALVNSKIATTLKNSTVNIDGNILPMFKDFAIQAIPDNMLTIPGTGGGNYSAYAYITNVGKAFTGITTVRTIQSEDFDGVALQGAGKAGEFIIEDNKKAVVKVTAPVPDPGV